MTMKVLGVATDLARGAALDGLTANTRRLHQSLMKRGVDMHLTYQTQYKRPGTMVAALRKGAFLLSLSARVLGGYDIIVAHTPFAVAGMLLPCKIWKKSLVYDMRDDYLQEKPGDHAWYRWHSLVRLIERINRQNVSAIRAVSRPLKARLEKEGCKAVIRYIPHGIDLDRIQAALLKGKVSLPSQTKDKILVGYGGVLSEHEGVGNLLLAMEILQDVAPQIVLLLIGYDAHNPREQRYPDFIQRRGLSNVVLYPRQELEMLYRLLASCDMTVVPLPFNPWTVSSCSTKFMESCALGKPALVTDVGDAADWVRMYRCGLVAEDNSPEELARVILQMTQGDLVSMGQNARRLAEAKFSTDKVAAEFINLFQSLM